MKTKQEIRMEMRQKRNSYPSVQIDSVKVWDVLESSDLYWNAKSIFTYCSFGSEVETVFTFERMIKQGKKVCLPRMMGPRTMEFHELEHLNQLERNRFGVYEPSMWTPVTTPDANSLMLIPGLVFDKNGNRLGFGGGYYDTYLEKFPNTKTMGVCFDFQLILDEGFELPIEPTDRMVDYILMPRGIYDVKKGIML